MVSYYTDPEAGDTKIKLWEVSATDPYPDISTEPQDQINEIDEITPIWEGGKRLQLRSADSRKIFTYIDIDNDAAVDESTDDLYDMLGELVGFNDDSSDLIAPYLG